MKSVPAQLQSITPGHFSPKWEMSRSLWNTAGKGVGDAASCSASLVGQQVTDAFSPELWKVALQESMRILFFWGNDRLCRDSYWFFASLMTCTTCTIGQLIIVRGLEAGFLDADRSAHSTQHYSSGTFWSCQQRGAVHPWGGGHEKNREVFQFSTNHALKDEMAPGLPAWLLWATNQLWGALCSGGFWVYSLSTYIHSFLISSWSCWHRNKAAVETLHPL